MTDESVVFTNLSFINYMLTEGLLISNIPWLISIVLDKKLKVSKFEYQ